MKKSLLAVVLCMAVSAADAAFEVEQVFRPERFTRGNTNLEPLQPIDAASWVWLEGVKTVAADYTPFVRLRCDFTVDNDAPLVFDVSADARFVLLLDGKIIARGPHKGMPEHWYYETYSVKGLTSGAHLMEALVFDPGRQGARSILSSGQNGFILKAEGAYDARLTTGKAKWRAAEVKSIRYGRVTYPGVLTGAETISVGTSYLDAILPEEAWREVKVVRKPIATSEYGMHVRGWALFPTERPDPIEVPRVCGAIRAVQSAFDEPNRYYSAADAADVRCGAVQALLTEGKILTIPPRTQLRFLWDLGDYYCAFPELEVSGGAGARIRWAWAERLYDREMRPGNRAEFLGKRGALSMDDTFICDGRDKAHFTTPWWRSGRWVEVAVETADAALTLTKLGLIETRYPLEPSLWFECDDASLAAVQQICVRGMQNCLHEMFMDCPYFEQQMYPGDTRVEMLVLNVLSYDERLLRFGMGIFDYARRNDGFVPMNFPSQDTQDSATYSMCWAMMAGDYTLWHGTNAWLKARLSGLRQTMSALAQYENAAGLLEGLPGWSFMDWVPEWDFYGNAPEGRRGLSALNNLLYIAALQSVAKTEGAFGEKALATYWREKARRVGVAVVDTFWSAARGMLADTMSKDKFSEHAQCLALLTDILPRDKAESTFKGLVEAPDLARTTVYFSHYLFETYLKFGRTDLFLKRLDLWRGYVKDGLKTPPEAPGEHARSDCHAWGAHPLYHLITGVAGITPSANGFTKVRIAPQPGELTFIRATMPSPKGDISVDLTFKAGNATGTVNLPRGMTGTFIWGKKVVSLVEGENRLNL